MRQERMKPGEDLDYEIEWIDTIGATDVIDASTWTITPAGLATHTPTNGQNITTIWAAPTTSNLNTTYTFENTIHTTGGRTYKASFELRITPNDPPITVAKFTDLWLSGLTLEDARGRPIPERRLQNYLNGVISRFQRTLGIRLEPTIIKLGKYNVQGDPPTASIQEQYNGLDTDPDDFLEAHQGFKFLPVGPITDLNSIYALGLWLPGTAQVISFASDWVHFDERAPYIRISPGSTLNPLSQGSIYAAQTSGYTLSYANFNSVPIPHAWHLTYQAGYTDLDTVNYDILDVIGKMAAVATLVPASIDRFLARGLAGQSVSVDALSQSVQLLQNSQRLKYGSLIDAYNMELFGQDGKSGQLRELTNRLKGPKLFVV